ncbi:hypothetical protein WJX73_008610 [Symbiochloris irregularis]|uniref:Desiccation-related protein PCC13-62 n=1 Tax=Symbiochloris irregularis TaxID=706552 RepID=A0AAW1P360_9CHLO
MKATSALCVFLALASAALAQEGPTAAPLAPTMAPTEAPAPASAANLTTLTDVDILNFALNLEYLEAEWYSCAATGQPLPSELRGGGPASTGCQKAFLGLEAQAIAEEFAQDETNHVRFLRNALGSQAVPIPQLNIGSAFSEAANAVTGEQLTPAFSAYSNDIAFYLGSYLFEDVGVTAYAGAAPLIKNLTYLGAAARIEAVEAYHGGAIRTQLYNNRNFVTPYNVTVAELVGEIAAGINAVDGNSDEVGIENANGAAELVPVNSMGLVYTRTPQKVIQIVTLGSLSGAGGFFPNGLNGHFAPSTTSQ